MATRSRSTLQPINLQPFNLQPSTLAYWPRYANNHSTLAYWPRDRVQPFNLQPWPIGHATRTNHSTFNLGLLATRSRSTIQPSTFKPWPIGHATRTNLGLLATLREQTLAYWPRYANKPSRPGVKIKPQVKFEPFLRKILF